MSPYVLRILVTEGNLDGVRVGERSNWTGKGVVFPGQLLKAAKRQGLDTPGVYVPIGEDVVSGRQSRLCIGQGDEVGKRLAGRVRSDDKDFSSETVVFDSSGERLRRAHIKQRQIEEAG